MDNSESESYLLYQAFQEQPTSQSNDNFSTWLSKLIQIRLQSPRVFIYSSAVDLILLQAKLFAVDEQALMDEYYSQLQAFAFSQQPSKPTVSSLLLLIQYFSSIRFTI